MSDGDILIRLGLARFDSAQYVWLWRVFPFSSPLTLPPIPTPHPLRLPGVRYRLGSTRLSSSSFSLSVDCRLALYHSAQGHSRGARRPAPCAAPLHAATPHSTALHTRRRPAPRRTGKHTTGFTSSHALASPRPPAPSCYNLASYHSALLPPPLIFSSSLPSTFTML